MLLPNFKEKVLDLYPRANKVFGPYTQQGRSVFTLGFKTGMPRRTTVLAARLLLEIKIGRRLTATETVDHIDGDKTNDTFDNLQILTRRDNAAKSVLRKVSETVNCIICGTAFTPSTWQKSRNKGILGAGPFCGRKCSGKYGASVRKTGVWLDRQYPGCTYYSMDRGVVKILSGSVTSKIVRHRKSPKKKHKCVACGKQCMTTTPQCLSCKKQNDHNSC